MIRRIARSLRAHAFLLVAFLGALLLLAGAFEWRRFYRDLYVEEREALLELSQFARWAAYRRAGEPPNVWSHVRDAPPVPFGAAFAGRVEEVRSNADIGQNSPKDVQRDARERLLRLPGVIAYSEEHAYSTFPTENPFDLAERLGRPLPPFVEWYRNAFADDEYDEVRNVYFSPFDESFDVEADDAEFSRPIPRGEPLPEPARDEIVRVISQAWIAARSIERPHLALVAGNLQSGEQDCFAALHDGNRDWSFRSWRNGIFASDESIEIVAHGTAQRLQRFGDDWRLTERRSAAAKSRLVEKIRPVRSPFFQGFGKKETFSPEEDDRDAFGGMEVTAVERIDDTRYRIALGPRDGLDDERMQLEQAEAIVRSDMNWAPERVRVRGSWTYENSSSRTNPKALREAPPDPYVVEVRDELRQLTRDGDHVYATSLVARVATDRDDYESVAYARYQMAVEFDPKFDEAVFDAGTYDVPPWPEPEPLPSLRTYGALSTIGGLLMTVGAIGCGVRFVATRRKRRTAMRVSASGRVPSRQSLPPLQFGFVTLGAAALVVISAAGWCKSKMDAMHEESALLVVIAAEGDQIRTVRAKAGFPFSLVSSETFPIDAPVTEAEMPAPSWELRDRMLRLPHLKRFDAIGGWGSALFDPTLPMTIDSGSAMPEVPPVTIDMLDFRGGMPRGDTIGASEARQVVDRLHDGWKKALLHEPTRYLVHGVSKDTGEFARLRDGERFWQFTWRLDSGHVAVSDGARRYHYARDGRDWTMTGCRRSDIGEAPDEEPWIQLWEADLDLPSFFAPLGDAGVARRLIELLERDPTAANVLDVERIDEDRFRFEFEPPRGLVQEPYLVTRWAVVANESRGWTIEESEIESRSPGGYVPSVGYQGFQLTTSRTLARFELRDDRPRLLERRTWTWTSDFDSDGTWATRLETPEPWRYAYDFSPTIDERIFRLPSLDYPHPPPDPVPQARFAWWMATALIAGGGFVFAAVGRVRAARRMDPRDRRPDDASVSQRATASNDDSEEATT